MEKGAEGEQPCILESDVAGQKDYGVVWKDGVVEKFGELDQERLDWKEDELVSGSFWSSLCGGT